jgi:hypothetical protein
LKEKGCLIRGIDGMDVFCRRRGRGEVRRCRKGKRRMRGLARGINWTGSDLLGSELLSSSENVLLGWGGGVKRRLGIWVRRMIRVREGRVKLMWLRMVCRRKWRGGSGRSVEDDRAGGSKEGRRVWRGCRW